MSQILASPPTPPQKRTERPAVWLWFWANPDTRSVKIGVLATIIAHLLFLLMAPYLFRPEPIDRYKAHHGAAMPLRIHLTQPAPPKPPEQRQRQQYVEANPNAPQNTPDHTNNFSDRNQQAAQEKLTSKGKSDRPTQKGRKDIQSNQIVDGRLVPPQPPSPPEPEVQQPIPKRTAAPKREQNPLSGNVKDMGDNPNGFGTNIAKEGNNRPIPNRIDGSKDAPLVQGDTLTTPQIDPKHPRPRQSLDIYTRTAIFSDNANAPPNMGWIGIDARWSNYGVYLNRMLDIIQQEWYSILDESKIYPSPGSTVLITFTLNSAGQVTNTVRIVPSSGSTDAGTAACHSSIMRPSPYGAWSPDMIAILGNQQDLTLEFLYE